MSHSISGQQPVQTKRSALQSKRDAFALKRARADLAHDKYVQKTYGLRPGEYLERLTAQDGRCAICTKRPRNRRLAVDHSHITGEVRGLLCLSCNHYVLARLEADPIALYNAIQYIRAIIANEFPEYE